MAAVAAAAAAATYSLAIPGCPLRELKRGSTTPPPERWCGWDLLLRAAAKSQDRDRDRTSGRAHVSCRRTSPRPRHACWRQPQCCRAPNHTCPCKREVGGHLSHGCAVSCGHVLGSDVRRVLVKHFARDGHASSTEIKPASPARNAWAVGARAVDAQHATRPRVGSIGTQAQAREGWRGDTFRRGRPRSLPQQQTRASASCSTSAARRPCTATDATSLTAGLAFASSSPPSLQHRRSRRRWLPLRHLAACPVTRPSRPDHRMAPSATSLRLRRRGAGVHSGRRCGHGSRGGSTKLRTTTLTL